MFGLKWSRFPSWVADVWREKPGAIEMFMMAKMAARALISPISKREYIARLTYCETKCPVFNHRTKACRNGEQGCGCYVPYKALAHVKCWKEEQDANTGWGAIRIPLSEMLTNKQKKNAFDYMMTNQDEEWPMLAKELSRMFGRKVSPDEASNLFIHLNLNDSEMM